MLRENWKIIAEEFRVYCSRDCVVIPQFDQVDPVQSYLNEDQKWRTLWLRCYGGNTQVSKYFPETMAILNSCGINASSAMFSVLEAGKVIPPHEGPYKGVLRYHLGLVVPPHKPEDLFLGVYHHYSDVNSDVPPELIHWGEGEDMAFDDTYVHFVVNNTVHKRVVLFLDFPRTDMPIWLRVFNFLFLRYIAKHIGTVKDITTNVNSFNYMSVATSAAKTQ